MATSGPLAELHSTALLVVLLSLGTPLSWKKTALSHTNTWLGFVIDPSGPIVQMAKEKHTLVLQPLDKPAAGEYSPLRTLKRAWAGSNGQQVLAP